MLKATINQSSERTIDKNAINNISRDIDLVRIDDISYHLLLDGKSFRSQLVSFDSSEKKIILLINGNEYEICIEDSTDLLLKKLGITVAASTKNNTFKAPMPGLIKQVLVAEGQSVKKGDVLLILEAMKMENALKATADGDVKKIAIKEGQAVEKGQLLIDLA